MNDDINFLLFWKCSLSVVLVTATAAEEKNKAIWFVLVVLTGTEQLKLEENKCFIAVQHVIALLSRVLP